MAIAANTAKIAANSGNMATKLRHIAATWRQLAAKWQRNSGNIATNSGNIAATERQHSGEWKSNRDKQRQNKRKMASKQRQDIQIHKIHAPKLQGHVFSELGEAPQAQALGTPSKKQWESSKYKRQMFQNTRGVFFFWGWRSATGKRHWAHHACKHINNTTKQKS